MSNSLKGVLPKDFARPNLDKQRLGQLIDLVSNIDLGDRESRTKDVLGRVYEYFLSQFASAEGKKGGRIGQISVYGQESNYTTWRLCKMNLANWKPDLPKARDWKVSFDKICHHLGYNWLIDN